VCVCVCVCVCVSVLHRTKLIAHYFASLSHYLNLILDVTGREIT
jgi:hypothetical protein